MTKYRALRSFEYPKDPEVRDAIRALKGKRQFEGDRGTITYVQEGRQVVPPDDLLDGWLKRGLIEEVDDSEK